MKLIRGALAAFLLLGTAVLAAGCGKEEKTVTSTEEIATIQRGDLALDISAIGNLALSEKETLAFEIAGTVTEVLVEEGDYAEEGQVLAKLDTSERDDYLKTLTRTIETKDQALLQAEINHRNAQEALAGKTSQGYTDQKTAQAKLTVANAEIALASAQKAYDVSKEKYDLNWTVPEYIRDFDQKTAQLAIAEVNLADAKDALAEVSDDIELEIEIKQKELVIAASKLEDAQKELDDARQALEEAGLQDWAITAPFDCFITKVNISEGSQVQKGSTALIIANPDEFEADVLVSEMDIFNISVGIPATVQVDAAQTVVLPAEIVKIAPTATISSGVVNYSVKIKIQTSDTLLLLEQQDSGSFIQTGPGSTAAGELPDMLKRAVEAGRMTKAQAEEMARAMESGNMTFPGQGRAFVRPGAGGINTPSTEGTEGETTIPGGGLFQGGFGSFTANQTFSQAVSGSGEFQLREGLTVTVSITTDTRTNVVLVPSAAIHTTNRLSYVTVVKPDGTREERQVTGGLSDWQNTEVLSGLSEGEQVVVPVKITSSSTQSQGGFMIPRVITGGGR